MAPSPSSPERIVAAGRRRVRVCCFNDWADRLEDAARYVGRVSSMDLASKVSEPTDTELMRKARLDCDWYAENVVCFGAMQHPALEFGRALVTGAAGILELAQKKRETSEEIWLIMTGQQPQALAPVAAKVFRFLAGAGVKIAFYAFDEASRFMSCFRELAPHLAVLIHDEWPLDASVEQLLPVGCIRLHRSWVANLVPFAAPFNPAPEPKIVFLGSQLGLTEHRRRQIAYLKKRYGGAFVAIHDHSLAVSDRFGLNRFIASVCPEGRKFTTPAMAKTHTDRPFWSGCLGLVPVSEDSNTGGRLDELAEQRLVLRYPHGDLDALGACCDRAITLSADERSKIYEHFNRHETVGTVMADAIARYHG